MRWSKLKSFENGKRKPMPLLETLLYWLNFKCIKPISSFHFFFFSFLREIISLEWPFNQNYDFCNNIPTVLYFTFWMMWSPCASLTLTFLNQQVAILRSKRPTHWEPTMSKTKNSITIIPPNKNLSRKNKLWWASLWRVV